MIKINNTNREYLGFIISYIGYLSILLAIIYYGYFMLNKINWGILGTLVLIITGIIYPILYYNSIKSEKEEIDQ
jgi:hypothetical protein